MSSKQNRAKSYCAFRGKRQNSHCLNKNNPSKFTEQLNREAQILKYAACAEPGTH